MTGDYSPRSTLSALRVAYIVLGLLSGLSGSIKTAFAQTNTEFQLAVHRDFGYGGGDQIQGQFTLEAVGPETLTSATFTIDDQLMGTVTTAPFKLPLNTDKYPHGWHTLGLTGKTSDGQTLTAAPKRFEFVDASAGVTAGFQIAVRIIVPVVALLALVLAIQFVPTLLGKRKTLPLGATRRYGLKGGAICPKCGRPFSIHLTSLNALTGYLDYCDHCGKWSFIKRATPEQLAEAERAEVKQAVPESPIVEETAEEKLQRQIEESRYVDEV